MLHPSVGHAAAIPARFPTGGNTLQKRVTINEELSTEHE